MKNENRYLKYSLPNIGQFVFFLQRHSQSDIFFCIFIHKIAFPTSHIVGIVQICQKVRPVGLFVTSMAFDWFSSTQASWTGLDRYSICCVDKVWNTCLRSFQFGIIARIILNKISKWVIFFGWSLVKMKSFGQVYLKIYKYTKYSTTKFWWAWINLRSVFEE